jgi:hypothetical protein
VRELAVKLAASRELYAYWSRLRGARSAPERDDVDPGAIRGVLSDTFILEFAPQSGFPLRVVGARSSALFQRELRGEPFLDLWRAPDRDEIRAVLAAVADEAQPFLIGASAAPEGVSPIDVEVLLLPLRHHGATHARVLGCCAPGAAPLWLGLLGVGALALLTLRALGRRDDDRLTALDPSAAASQFGRAPQLIRRGQFFVHSPNR